MRASRQAEQLSGYGDSLLLKKLLACWSAMISAIPPAL
jgi:hypothetical protein